MKKLSMDQIAALVEEAPAMIEGLVQERDVLRDKVAAFERRDAAEKVASAMHNKGIRLDTEFGALAEELEKEAELGNLPVIRQAVELTQTDFRAKHASLSDDEYRGGSSDFERYILGGIG